MSIDKSLNYSSTLLLAFKMKFRSEDGVAIKDFETQLANEFDFLKNAEFELSLSSVLEKCQSLEIFEPPKSLVAIFIWQIRTKISVIKRDIFRHIDSYIGRGFFLHALHEVAVHCICLYDRYGPNR